MAPPRRPTAALFAALVAVGFAVVAYVLLHPTDESRIRAQLDKLAAVVRITDADAHANPIGRLAHVNDELAKLFEANVHASIPQVPSLGAGRAELAALVAGAPSYVRTFDVDFTNVTVKLDDAHTTAFVGATARVKLVERDGDASQDRRAIDLRFVHEDGEWVIRTLRVWTKDDAAPP
jgi:hypothetical protein